MKNARCKNRAEQDYILRSAVVATPENYPELYRIFDSMKRKTRCGKRLTLMVGESRSAGMAIERSPHTGIILIDRREIPFMNEKEMQCLLGHELGHLLGRDENRNKPQPGKFLYDMSFPIPLMHLFSHLSGQIVADIHGVEQCHSAFVAGSHLSEGDSEMHELYNNPLEPLPQRFFDDFELAIRIKALGLLSRSEFYYELIGSELFGYGRWQMTTEEYFEKIEHLFDPYIGFADEDGMALGAFLGACLFIAGCKAGDLCWRRELDLLESFGDTGELLAYASKDDAYERLKSLADSVRDISHPLKYIVMNFVEAALFREDVDFDETERLEDFLAGMIGIDSTAA